MFLLLVLTILAIDLPFEKVYNLRRLTDFPVLLPEGVGFQSKATFNPAAIKVNDEILLFYRAEDWTGYNAWNGTSSIGLARSTDGLNFTKEPDPIIKPELPYEIPGGCEDPRIVEIDGLYILTYTAYDGNQARLCLAYSSDLKEWVKVGPIIKNFRWSKSGAIVPKKINGKYYMYFGDSQIYLATSKDLKSWNVNPYPVLRPRPDKFDARLVEPGPPPLITSEGILLFYNSADYSGIYRVGAALFDAEKPSRLLKRTDTPLLEPELSWEKYGQVPNVVFVEGAVEHQGKLLLYYGAADVYVGVAAIDL
ncbi:glycoside hydrolase family 130 protein [Kosmotoga pacifica]|nr:glycoside hydrolase family 130 protein [Kosmotoga pacifica]